MPVYANQLHVSRGRCLKVLWLIGLGLKMLNTILILNIVPIQTKVGHHVIPTLSHFSHYNCEVL